MKLWISMMLGEPQVDSYWDDQTEVKEKELGKEVG